MAIQAPSIPKGTRDFGPLEVSRRNYIFNTIRNIFRNYGFEPIETPAMENLTTLLGKYGEEGDKLLFRVLNSGDFMGEVPAELLSSKDSLQVSNHISEKGLRYDLTVPFARYVVQHYNELVFPFKRYQVQPVWRADRPQKGRYREFYQCDADVIGSDSLRNEAELVMMISEVFASLQLNVLVKLNNRKILSGIAEMIGASDKIIPITVAIDKIDKIGIDKVNEELGLAGIGVDEIKKLQPILTAHGTNNDKLDLIGSALGVSGVGMAGISEMKELLDFLSHLPLTCSVEIDLSLARGLEYYTGTIIEVKSLDAQIGSICGGGRYDNLTGIFGLKGVSGVGVSFGADRIYDVLLQTQKFPPSAVAGTQVLFVNFGREEANCCQEHAAQLRKNGIRTEVYPDAAKMKKQLDYANKKGIPFVVMVGEEEMKNGFITLKKMDTGEQTRTSASELAEMLKT
ncbi:MAG: histidine--tRNA ligase [Bacteroidales bacterium]